MNNLLVIWLAALSASAYGYVALEGMEGGACINAKLADNFDINKFQGVWYEAQSAPNMFQLTKKCTKMEYTWNGNVVRATTTGLGEEDQPTEQSSDMTQSAVNGARWIIRPPEAPDMEVPFDILSTDYMNYACAYSCLKYENFKAEFTWALTRDNGKLTGAGAICKTAFQKNNIDVSKLANTYHGPLCDAPPKASSGRSRKSGLPPFKPNNQSSNNNLNTKTTVKTQSNNNTKEKKRKYNWTPNTAKWKPNTPRTKQRNNNEVNYNARIPYKGYQGGNQPTVTNVQSTIPKKPSYNPSQTVKVKTESKSYNPYKGYRSTNNENVNKPTVTNVQSTVTKKTTYKPSQSVEVKTESKSYNPYIGYRSTKDENINKPTVTNVLNTSQKKSPYNPYQSVQVKTVNKGYNPYIGYRKTKEENLNKPTITNVQSTIKKKTPYKPIQRVEVKKENKAYNPYITFRSTKKEIISKPNKNENKRISVTQKSIKTAEAKTENKEKQIYVGYRGKKRVDTNIPDKSEDTTNNVSIYKELKSSDEEALIPKNNKVYKSNWGTTYGIRRENAWGDLAKQNDEASRKERVRPYSGYKLRQAKRKSKQKGYGYKPKPKLTEGYSSRNQRRRSWSTIESIKVDRAPSSNNKPEKKQTVVKTEVAVSECKDNEKFCRYWATSGECEKNPLWMNSNCQKSCGKCDKSASSLASSSVISSSSLVPKKSCTDKDSGCQGWATMGECKKNPGWMNFNCPFSCGKCS